MIDSFSRRGRQQLARRLAAALPAALVWLSPDGQMAAASEGPLRMSVYATAGDVTRYLSSPEQRERVIEKLRPLDISRVFLEGRRGDEYVPVATLSAARNFLESRGIHCSGGIATVPGTTFGHRQDSALAWLNWESEKTRKDVAAFFTENAPVFEELIVDDFYCTADTSPASEKARRDRPWPDYRRELLTSLVGPLMRDPARVLHPGVELIIKFPQWYDRFHLFGYDPPRMAALFDRVWVGTEVRDPNTRRMGFVQPTEGYMNFRWLASVAGRKASGAWFDHIECSEQNFVDQAFLSVLAGARELTLFRLGDVMEGHPGDAPLARRLPELRELAAKVRDAPRGGIPFYKAPAGDPAENLYLADYLGMIGLPILPVAQYPADASVVFLGAQAAAEAGVINRVQEAVQRGAQVTMTPAFIRKAGPQAASLAGISVRPADVPETARFLQAGSKEFPLTAPLEIDAGMQTAGARMRMNAFAAGNAIPFLTERKRGRGKVLMLNVRTFAEEDFRKTGEWLLAPEKRGLPQLPEEAVREVRRELLKPLGLDFVAPSGVALFIFGEDVCLYSFREERFRARVNARSVELMPHGWSWVKGVKTVRRR